MVWKPAIARKTILKLFELAEKPCHSGRSEESEVESFGLRFFAAP
jgi:hypothetical protein